MTRRKTLSPLRIHKHTGQAYVNIDGRRLYLGKAGSPDVELRYHQVLAEWEAGGRTMLAAPAETTIVELAARFWLHAEAYYRRSSSRELEHFREVLKPLKQLYGHTTAREFGPNRFKTVRQQMIKAGWARTHINKQCVRLKHIFKWAVEAELIPASVYHSLQAVSGLRRGRSDARETESVRPAPEMDLNAVAAHVPPDVAALMRLQVLTAARAGELVQMRPMDLDMSGPVWLYEPRQHKGTFMGRTRTVFLGPKSQAIVREFLAGCAVDGHLFSPKRAMQWRHAQCNGHRRTDQKPNPRLTKRTIGGCYTTASYRRCITRACKRLGIEKFTPHRLRHSAATAIRRQFGIEGAQLLLGHARADVTQLYAEINREKACSVALKIG